MLNLVGQTPLFSSVPAEWALRGTLWWAALRLLPAAEKPESAAGMAATVAAVLLLEAGATFILRRWLALLVILSVGLISPFLVALGAWAVGMHPSFPFSAGFWSIFGGAITVNIIAGVARLAATTIARTQWERREYSWTGDLLQAQAWLSQQRQSLSKEVTAQEAVLADQRAWIDHLEQGRDWLTEQRDNWRRSAEYHEQALQAAPDINAGLQPARDDGRD